MKHDYKQNVGNMSMYLLYRVHRHSDYDIDVDEHIVHCMVMENNRYARNKKNNNHFILERMIFLCSYQKNMYALIDIYQK